MSDRSACSSFTVGVVEGAQVKRKLYPGGQMPEEPLPCATHSNVCQERRGRIMYFEQAYARTKGHEGGYVNDADDVGGETYKGISRIYNPLWSGWYIIDRHKSAPDFEEQLEEDTKLQGLVRALFKGLYFDPYLGDTMPQELAMEMFDTSVNLGIGRAIKYLQTAVNVLNKNGTLWSNIVADGSYGPNTHAVVQKALAQGNEKLIVKIINVMQGSHYLEYMSKSEQQEKYARGWFERVAIEKS